MNKEQLKENILSEIKNIQFYNQFNNLSDKERKVLLPGLLHSIAEHSYQLGKEDEKKFLKEKILTFIDSGKPEPSNDTGWSIELNDVKDFISLL